MKAALYHRVSTVDQDPTLARAELRTAAAARGFEIALDIEETGSGARNDRPGLQRVLDAARRAKVSVVLVWKLDRFGRSALDLLGNIDQLGKAGCRFIAITQGIDVGPEGDPMSRLLLAMLAAIAEFERELITERTKLGLARARRAGKRLGRPRNDNAPDGATVRAMRARGRSWAVIARTLACSPSAARRAVRSLAENGTADREVRLDDDDSAA